MVRTSYDSLVINIKVDLLPLLVCQHAFQDGTSLLEEQWNGSPPEELDDYVSELCYIHRQVPSLLYMVDRPANELCLSISKLMIVDDRRIICGSANLNGEASFSDLS